MKALIFGRSGQLATELARRKPADVQAVFLSRAQADQTDPAACAARIGEHRPDVVINAAAYTAVDKAEEEEHIAHLVNADTPAALAHACAHAAIPFLHVSTDYVFDGSGTAPWHESDPTGPLGVYGRSKLAGENAIRAAGGPHAILRTSWVVSAHGSNFVKTMLRLSQTHPQLRIVADQVGGPTPAAAIADALWQMARELHAGRGRTGTYHFSGTPDVSWADFARAIFELADRPVTVQDIPARDYPTPAARPANSRLDCSALHEGFGILRPDWHAGLQDILEDLEKASTP